MKLLVTGGAGFIGSNFIQYWLNKYPHDQIVNLDNLTYAGNLENLTAISTHPNYQFIKGDICDPQIVDVAINGCTQVVHFAAETHVDRSIISPDTFIKTNIEGTFILLEAAKKNKVKFHHISTDEVFGSLFANSTDKFTLNTPYKPNNPYSASKASSDHLVKAYYHTFGLPITISNCSNNYGPFQFIEKFIPLTITNLLENKAVPIYGNGQQIRDWLFVTDHCMAIDLIINNGKIGQTYLIGGQTQDITNLEIVKKIIYLMGKSESLINFIKDRPGHDVRYAIDWSTTQKELGYNPKYSFDEYLKLTINWYINHQSWWQNIKSGEYQTYYQKQYLS